MSKISIKEIPGHESPAISRLTINDNFLMVENAINNFENFINTSEPAGKGQLGELLLTSTNPSIPNFTSEGSGQFKGNLIIDGVLTVNGITTLEDELTINNSFNVTGAEAGSVIKIGEDDPVAVHHKQGAVIHEDITDVIDVPDEETYTIPDLNEKKYICLSDNTSETHSTKTIILDGLENGQIITIIIIANQYENNKFEIDGVELNGSNVAMGGDNWEDQWLTIIRRNDKLRIINASPNLFEE